MPSDYQTMDNASHQIIKPWTMPSDYQTIDNAIRLEKTCQKLTIESNKGLKSYISIIISAK